MACRSLRLSRLITLSLLLYWLAILLGTHLPSGVVALPVASDKLQHVAAFLGLGFLLAWAGVLRRRPSLALYGGLFVLALAYGAVDELTQTLVPGRTADLRDWLADAAGAALGFALHRLALAGVQGWRRSRSQPAGESP